VTLYLDTSSLVKLYVAEPDSDAVRKLVDAATVVATSSIAYAETRAALASLRPAAFPSAKKTFETVWPKYFSVDVTSALCREAGEFAERYRLRAMTACIWLHSPKLPAKLESAPRVSQASTTRSIALHGRWAGR